jgi:DNA ligase (NAD+)
MDIVGLGINTVQQLVQEGLLHNIADLYHLEPPHLLGLEGFAEKKAENLVSAIQASKTQPLWRLIVGLGIHGVGEVAAQVLAEHFHDLDALSRATGDEIESIEGFGPNIAESIVQWFYNEENQAVLRKLKASGVWPAAERQAETGPQPLAGLTFVITGTLPALSRSEAKTLIESHGGKVTGSVSGSTDYLLLGEDPGSKLDQARKRAVPTLSEEDLHQFIKDRAA